VQQGSKGTHSRECLTEPSLSMLSKFFFSDTMTLPGRPKVELAMAARNSSHDTLPLASLSAGQWAPLLPLKSVSVLITD
jgi:hypothetical protein